MKTIEQAKQWATAFDEEFNKARLSHPHPDIQMLNRLVPDKSKALWDSGCWLKHELEALGASQKEIAEAQFACGQRSFIHDPWKIAVLYVNEYQQNGKIQDKPGNQLGDEINKQIFGT